MIAKHFQIGVVIPSYNRIDLLFNALNSINDQSLKPSCVVIIDDYSDYAIYQKNCEILDSLLFEFDCVHIRNDSNKGPSYSRNLGRKILKGKCDLIAYLDSDDTWHPHKLEACSSIMVAHNIPVLIHDFTYKYCELNLPKKFDLDSVKNIRFYQALLRNSLSPPCLMHIHEIPIYFNQSMRYCEDYLFKLECLAEGIPVSYASFPYTALSRPVLSPGGLSSSTLKMRLGEITCYYYFLRKINKIYLLPVAFLTSIIKHFFAFFDYFIRLLLRF